MCQFRSVTKWIIGRKLLFSSQANIIYAGEVNIAVDAYLHNLPCYVLTKEMYEIQNKNFDMAWS